MDYYGKKKTTRKLHATPECRIPSAKLIGKRKRAPFVDNVRHELHRGNLGLIKRL